MPIIKDKPPVDPSTLGSVADTDSSTTIKKPVTTDPLVQPGLPKDDGSKRGVGVDATLSDAGITPKTLQDGARGLFDAIAGVDPAKPSQTAPSIQKLYTDPSFKELYDFTINQITTIEREHRQWDELGQVKAFSRAVNFVTKGTGLDGSAAQGAALFQRFSGAQERRAMAHLLMLLMPKDERTEQPVHADGGRGTAQGLFHPLPDAVINRADDGFQLTAGDLPKVAPIFTQHLSSAKLLDSIFKPGQQGIFLASKSYCPGAFLQDRKDINPTSKPKSEQVGHEGDPIFVRVLDVVQQGGKKMAKVEAVEQHASWLGDGGRIIQGDKTFDATQVVLDTQGKPVQGSDGKPKEILIPVEHLADYLLDPGRGSGARGLNMSSEEDRAIALTYADGLRHSFLTDSNGITKSLFNWLEKADQRTPRQDVDRIKEEVRQVGWQTIARYACHPRRTHFKIDLGPDQGDWQHEAYSLLKETGIMQDCGNRYEKDKDTTAEMHEMAWTGHFLGRGFIGGSLDCYGLATAFDRLSATFLVPLGIMNKTDLAEGHGSELHRILSQPDDNGVIQVGVPMKSKLNEMIVGLDARLSSGRGPSARYMENWPGYLKISGVGGKRIDFAMAQSKMQEATP